MRRNRLRELMDSDKPSLGTHIHSPWPSIIEMVGHSEMFDYVEYVAEYAPYDLYTLENMGRAVDLFEDFSAMIKIEQEVWGYLASRAMGSGIQNLLFADVHTAEDVETCVSAVRAETPDIGGKHGVNARRYVRFGADANSPEFVKALEDAVVAVMIEKASAVENLEELLSVKGLDMVQFGPADFSLSSGLIGQSGHETSRKVKEAEQYVIETALKMGIAPRAEISNPEQAKRYLDMGVRHFCMGTDVSILRSWFQEQGEEMAKVLLNF